MDFQEATPDLSADLRKYLGIVSRRYKLILATIAIALVAAALVTMKTKPTYVSSATLLVSPRNTADYNKDFSPYDALLMSERLAKTYSAVMTTPAMTEKVAKRLGLDSPSDLGVTTTAQTDSAPNLITISVTGKDKRQAQRVADMTAKVFIAELPNLEGSSGSKEENSFAKVSVVQPAQFPEEPAQPAALNIALALVAGSIAGLGTAFVAEFLAPSAKNI